MRATRTPIRTTTAPAEPGGRFSGFRRGRHRRPRRRKALLAVGGLVLAAAVLSLVRMSPESGVGAPGTAAAEPRLGPGVTPGTTAGPTLRGGSTATTATRTAGPDALAPAASVPRGPGTAPAPAGSTRAPAAPGRSAAPPRTVTTAPSAPARPTAPASTASAPPASHPAPPPKPTPTPDPGQSAPAPGPGGLCLPVIGLCVDVTGPHWG
ncbi:hypothetical protein SAMN04490357_4923 [Streptomyces misionensis]|uniref:Uncharacterized protein n=1 Tax=Streptomyces misionensis TaxID=67331 RepID=A0A1H5B0S1_9ACTN|nr:hypothetical protein [Streptomyces misionensis]SED47986.1 hypothetical protein SAMN04490357_4923 [Streptomyces misionensis]